MWSATREKESERVRTKQINGSNFLTKRGPSALSRHRAGRHLNPDQPSSLLCLVLHFIPTQQQQRIRDETKCKIMRQLEAKVYGWPNQEESGVKERRGERRRRRLNWAGAGQVHSLSSGQQSTQICWSCATVTDAAAAAAASVTPWGVSLGTHTHTAHTHAHAETTNRKYAFPALHSGPSQPGILCGLLSLSLRSVQMSRQRRQTTFDTKVLKTVFLSQVSFGTLACYSHYLPLHLSLGLSFSTAHVAKLIEND